MEEPTTPDIFNGNNMTPKIVQDVYGITGIWPPTLIIARLILAEARSTEIDTTAHHVPWEEHDPQCVPWDEGDPRRVPWEEYDP